ncbi:enoyl-ACP reductase FabI [Leeia sp. TBRC 13508]|uniref:Enoyl-[acyl-carrier-protein] reductase [NADH] n=1 Tax=Leeia speluncae TaxID=2884804 RepID=A0ABS8D858_9NEIS|nr:enoyl-ACP reductase FabI [Leeia speluncae]MCB6184388.1 enoyl-ACP reductase FabI [Leeia speluncae]
MGMLTGKIALVVGVANEHSIAWGCAKAFHEAGAIVVLTHLNEKAEKFVRPLADSIHADLLPLNVEFPGELENVFGFIKEKYGKLDIALHSIAFAEKDDLHGRLVDCSAAGFARAMDVSCHSLIRLAKEAEPLMVNGGSIITMSYYGSEKVVRNYNMMGPVKAALEASVRYLADNMGPSKIRVNAISPGPLATRAASGLPEFESLMNTAIHDAPEHRLVTIEEVGALAAFLGSDGARGITGNTEYIDAGYHIIG